MSFLRRSWWIFLLVMGVLGTFLWAAFAPIYSSTRDHLFEIPEGTFARRMAGEQVEILPSQVHLMLGVQDVLLLRNSDSVPQMFGPTLIMPGQNFRLPFEQASDYQFACSAHANGQMTIIVAEQPARGWERLRWRFNALRERPTSHQEKTALIIKN